jgi:hypothetical protein
MKLVPQLARSVVGNENCEYVNQAGWNKDCYLSFEIDKCEKVYYCSTCDNLSYSCDVLETRKSELCYETVNCFNCYNLKYSQDCENCHESWFLKNCIGCSNCFGCVNLRNKQYYFLNKKCSNKEEFQRRISELKLSKYSSYKNLRKNFAKFITKFPQKYRYDKQVINCTGNYLRNSKDCYNCFDIINSHYCKHVFYGRYVKNVYDFTVFGGRNGAEWCLENHEIGDGVRNICFSDQIWSGCHDIFYSKLCLQGSHNLFGCIGLRHAQYCILNKQYTKEEYFRLREKIIEHMKKTGEWGEFFPIELSPFCYNETVAQEYFPIQPNPLAPLSGGIDQQVLHQSPNLNFKYKWKDKISRDFKPATIQNIPDDISEVEDSICREILACENEECKKNYQIQKPELRFYRKMNLPIPRKCPDCRHAERMKLRNPRKLFSRNCTDCGKDIQTTFAPDRPEKVLCEDCYLKVVD